MGKDDLEDDHTTSTGMMTRDAAAAFLNGSEYADVGTPSHLRAMKAAGLVAVYGLSNDLIELRGAIDEEVEALRGGVVSILPDGIIDGSCTQDHCPYRERLVRGASTVTGVFDDDAAQGHVWRFETDLPHTTFETLDNGEPFCLGVVVSLEDVARVRGTRGI